jgi:hypothetical protein
MERYIKYKRHLNSFPYPDFEKDLQEWLDKLVTDGWEIINYNEVHKERSFDVIILAGKKQNNIL